ncbi:hypothetical protein ACFL02_00010 [Planctomycetota bacterium]
MNIRILKLIMPLVILVAISSTQAQSGDGYDLSWNTIDGGGGKSMGGAYELEGTIGQPDAGVMEGGGYILAGGFWPGSRWCHVDIPDLFNFLQDWLKTGPGWAGDLNDDNSVDLVDYNIIANHWLHLCPDTWPWW